MTKAERRHIEAVVGLGCILCRVKGNFTPYPSIHHIRRHGGKRDNAPVIGLCSHHHQTGGIGEAVHAGRESWEQKQGVSEWILLEKTLELLEET